MKKTLLLSLAFSAIHLVNMNVTAMEISVSDMDAKKAAKLAKLEAARKKINAEAASAAKKDPKKAAKLAAQSLELKPEGNATGNYILSQTAKDQKTRTLHLEAAASSSQSTETSKAKIEAIGLLNKSNSQAATINFVKEFKAFSLESEIIDTNELTQSIITFIKEKIKIFPDKKAIVAVAINQLKKQNASEDVIAGIETYQKTL